MAILKEIEHYLATHERSNSALALDVIRHQPDPFSRRTLPGHITGSAFVVDVSQRLALLIHHAALGIWVQPGGHVDPGENPVDAALRETAEETGVTGALLSAEIFDVDIHPIPESTRKAEPAHHHIDVRYLVGADSRQAVTISADECHGYTWKSLEAIAQQADSVGRMARLALEWIDQNPS